MIEEDGAHRWPVPGPLDNQRPRAVRRSIVHDDDLVNQPGQLLQHLDHGSLFVVHRDNCNPARLLCAGYCRRASLENIHVIETAAASSSRNRPTSQGTVRSMP